MKAKVYKTDTWEFNANNSTLCHNNKQIKLRNHLAQIMLMMCSNHDHFVAHEQMIDEIWNGNYAVGAKSIRNTIWELRKHVPDIKTVPKKGYQLTVDVVAIDQRPIKHPSINAYVVIITFLVVILAWLLLTQQTRMSFTPFWCYSASHEPADHSAEIDLLLQ